MPKQHKKLARFELLMDAGFGAQKAGDILIKAFARMGQYVFIEPLIPAEISPPPRTRPALSGVIIRVADFELNNIGNNTDLLLASHEIVLDRRLDDEETNPNVLLLLDMCDKKSNEETYEKVLKRVNKLGLHVYPFEISDEAQTIISSLAGKGKNMFYLGMLSEIYSMPQETVIEEIRASFGKKLKEDILEKNFKLFELGYNFAKKTFDFSFEVSGKPHQQEEILIDGNTALSLGVIDAGIKFYSGYPITPASSIMHTLAREFPFYGGIVHQAEDEIAAIGAVIGAYFGGIPSITATSGPGLSLKQEFIGYATVAEIPLIVIDVQRGGPSTGLPTKTEQSDLLPAIFGNHGDYAKIVISVGNITDCFFAPQIARYLAEKLRLPVFILSDFQTANSYKVVKRMQPSCVDDIEKIPDYPFDRFRLGRLPKEIPMVRDSEANPGEGAIPRRVTGLNTDASGSVNYFAGANQRAHMIRNQKVQLVKQALRLPEMFGPSDGGDVLVVGWGSSRGAIEEAVINLRNDGVNVSGMNLRIIYPLPAMLKDVFSKFKRVVTVELAYGDEKKAPPLMMMLRAETLCDVQCIVCRATGRPIRPATIREKIKEIL